jgi:hypothetical protein
MGNELKFSLGLLTGSFLTNLTTADAKVRHFIGGMLSLGAVTHGVMKAMETGAELHHLHMRTGESVGDLVKLQAGFKAAGLAADDVGPALWIMEKSLGGINEFGQGTATTFQRLGLSITKLKAMGGAQAMAAILNSLKGLNQSDAVKAASVIFGRMQAGNMLQLARSSGEFAEGMEKAAAKAAIFQENSASFAKIMIMMDQIKAKGMVLFAGIASGLAPAMLKIEELLNGIDLSGIGKELGKYLTAIVQAFSEGSLSLLISETLRVGFDGGIATLPAMFERLGGILLNVFKTPLTYLAAGIAWVLERAALFASRIPGVGKALFPSGLGDAPAESFDTIRKNISGEGYYDKLVSDADEDSAKRMTEALSKLKDIGAPLRSMIDSLVSRARKDLPKAEDITKGGAANLPNTGYKPEFTQLEKMGFVMSGLGGADYASRTATATERIANLMETFIDTASPQPSLNEA